ncbi:dolichyl-P-Man:Man(7)GlcNAc(2)-PP-dolichol alpha-1,6-mannosyltransferase [Xylographa soralifera]|nr:dolichyl-P-Man:Man(7)GlcNAc(2)-PP-dolichol alpha-1,6-mannosyltransferase [Xylographa soralifera]
MRRLIDASIALLVPLLIVLHLYVAPYTKVEESFNIQATHDIITYGVPFQNTNAYLEAHYDHLSFPGSVPRTFLGPLALAGVAWPFAWLVEGVDKQILVRAILGLYNAFSILVFRNGIAHAFGSDTANWYILFQASQFHVMYYASRTLPNFFAFGISTIAFRSLTPSYVGSMKPPWRGVQEYRKALVMLTVIGVTFRSEIAILLGCHTAWLLFNKRLSPTDIVTSGVLGLAIGLGLTVSVDSFFWQKIPLWPELSGFVFNILKGRSAEWGTSPFHYYFTSAFPRLLLNPLTWQVCIPMALTIPALRDRAFDMLVPNMVFFAVYSLQPHKEWRFIIYVLPSLTAVAAMGASWIWTRRTKSFIYRVLAVGLVASTLGTFAVSLGMLVVSSFNYPGAEALNYLHAHADGSQNVINVHMDTLSCMTGVTRFLQIASSQNTSASNRHTLWLYDKTENETQLLYPGFWEKFDYALAERPEKAIGGWEILHTIDGFTGVQLLRPGETSRHKMSVDTSLTQSHQMIEDLWPGVRNVVYHSWLQVEDVMRERVTGGWWVQAKLEPQIRILRSTKESA